MRFWPVIVVLLGKRFDPDVVIEDRRTVNGPAQESLFYKAANLRTSVHCFSCSLTRLDVHSSLSLPNANLRCQSPCVCGCGSNHRRGERTMATRIQLWLPTEPLCPPRAANSPRWQSPGELRGANFAASVVQTEADSVLNFDASVCPTDADWRFAFVRSVDQTGRSWA
jgi:hypothetical protein